jgi:uncharacterized protein YbjT (DUF2867 family)
VILVTGATGTIGCLVANQLYAEGITLRAFVRDPKKAAGMLSDGVEVAAGDFGDRNTLERALEGVDTVFLACPNHPRQVEFETGVIDAARSAVVSRVVKLSAHGAEAGSPVAFWDWHGRIEQHLADSGMRYSVIRPTFSMANLLSSAEQIRTIGTLFAPAEGAKIAMIDPLDVASAAAALLPAEGRPNEVLPLTGPEAVTFDEVAEALSSIAERKITYVAVVDEAARSNLVSSGMPEWLAEPLVALFGILRQGAHSIPTDEVRSVTGREPRSVTDFLRDHADSFRLKSPTP